MSTEGFTVGETVTALEDLISIFAAEDDIALLENIKESLLITEHTTSKDIAGMKAELRDLAEEVNTVRGQFDHAKLKELKHQFNQADNRTRGVFHTIKSLAHEKHSNQRILGDIDQEIHSFNSLKSREESELASQLPGLENLFKVYTRLSNIEFDLDAEDQVRGYVHLAESGRIVQFEMDVAEETSFDIANTLWDLIGQ